MPNPRVSFLMTVFNAELFIRETVDAVLNQTSGDFEFIIVDDKSTDRSLEILKSYHDPRIALVEKARNQGQTACLIEGLAMSKGEYVARIDADDICLPNRLAVQVDYVTQHPEISVIGSAAIFFDDKGHEFTTYQPENHDAIKCELLYGFTMFHPSVLFRRRDFEQQHFNYDPHFQCSQDHDLWTRAIRKLRFGNIHQPLLRIRVHREQMGKTQKNKMWMESNEIRQRQLDELGVDYSAEELKAFNIGASGAFPNATVNQLAAYDRVVNKIIEANKVKNIFDQTTLSKIGAAKLRGLCRVALLENNPSGRYYWRSQLRTLDDISIRQRIGILYRSLCLRYKKN